MKNVVIIGGGFAGAYAAKKLEKDFSVTLIDAKDYFEFTPSVLRTIVEPEHMKRIQVLHSHYLHKAQLVRDDAVKIKETEVLTKKKSYGFDYLIICSGSKYNTPIKEMDLVITSRAQELRNYAQKLQEADKVLIIGGGIVGVELAAEIVERFPFKKITLVHSKTMLIERNHPKAQAYAQHFLEERGVIIRFNEKVVSSNQRFYITDKGTKLEADLAFLCTGIIPNYEYLEPECSTSLNEKKSLCVNDFLQVQRFRNVFAAGDITNIPEEKTAQAAEKQATIVVKNIYHLEEDERLEKYNANAKPMDISLGRWHGIFAYRNVVLTGIIPGIFKRIIEWKTMRRYKN